MVGSKEQNDSVTVGVVGLSHLGLVTGLGLASRGLNLVGYDPRGDLIAELKVGKLPVHEDNLSNLLADSKMRTTFTSGLADLTACDVVYIARDVPTTAENISEIGPVVELFEQILPYLKQGTTLVIHSQVSPGFTRSILPLVVQQQRDLKLYYQVETLVFGIAVSRMLNPERYIVGCEDPNSPLPVSFAAVLSKFDCPVLPMAYESAELTKISINFFLVSSVTTTNTLAELCEKVGADWQEIAPALRLDRRIGKFAYLSPGLGIAGGNLERDLVTVQSLARQHGTDTSVVEAWLTNAQYRRDWVLRELSTKIFRRNTQTTIGVWGIAYKPDTHSIKNSPAIALLDALRGQNVRAYDPQVGLGEREGGSIVQAGGALDACHRADVLVLMTPWREFLEIDPAKVAKQMKGRIVFDPYGALNQESYRQNGFTIYRLGK